MARRRAPVPQRERVFLAGEGESEAAFGAWLNGLCEGARLHLHLDVQPLGGGDPLALVEQAIRLRAARSGRNLIYKASVLLIDTDRLDDGSERSRRAIATASRGDLRLVRQRPRFQSLVLRLHARHERTFLFGADIDVRLGRVWSDYKKGRVTRYDLSRRFTHADLLRAAACDEELQALVALLGLR